MKVALFAPYQKKVSERKFLLVCETSNDLDSERKTGCFEAEVESMSYSVLEMTEATEPAEDMIVCFGFKRRRRQRAVNDMNKRRNTLFIIYYLLRNSFIYSFIHSS